MRMCIFLSKYRCALFWTVSKTPPPVSHCTSWDTVRHPRLVSQDTPSSPTLQHFFCISLTNELMDFCRSIWWICAGGNPDFLTDRCPKLVVGRMAFMKTKSRDSHHDQSLISDCSDIWLLLFTWSIQSMPSFHSKIMLVLFSCPPQGLKKYLHIYVWWLWPYLIGGNQFPIMNTLSCDGSERTPVWEIAPIFCGIFNLSPNLARTGGQIAHLEPRLKN